MFQIAMICEDFGWTWEEYQDQPEDFTRAILLMKNINARIEKAKAKELERKRK